jgi:N-methylhydantoinase A
MARMTRLAADVGGTFTDIAAFDERTGELRLGKVLSTPQHLADGIENGVAKAEVKFRNVRLFLHGTTVVINTILERTGAPTALVTTEGFRDIYEIGRINRPEAYNLFFQKHDPLVPRSRRFELRERVNAQGEILLPLEQEHLTRVLGELDHAAVQAVAILFLHSYKNPAHETRVKQAIEAAFPEAFVTASHELSQEYREFERTSTVVANAYVGPRVRSYLSEISARLRGAGFEGAFLIVQSTGGLFDVNEAQRACIKMLESGPAAGVIGTRSLCSAVGLPNAIAFDMGGTTAKAGVIHEGEVLMTGSALLGGYARALPVQIPMLDIQEVGTGGGSIARVEVGGALRVGPQSAGAQPGPVCYGLGGTEPTVTDANLVLGRLAPDRFLGGEMLLDSDAARRVLEEKIAKPLRISLTDAADGILRIAVTRMAHVVRWVTTERGLDPAAFALVAYGGAGPLHAAAIARELRIGTVIIPSAPGHFSSCGMLAADVRRDYVRTSFMKLADASFDSMEEIFVAMEQAGAEGVAHAGISMQEREISRGADMRYVGQEHAVTVNFPLALFQTRDRAGIKRHFDEVHEVRYGYASPSEPAEIVSLRSAVTGPLRKPAFQRIEAGTSIPSKQASRGARPVYFAEASDYVETATFARAALLAGNRIEGPALVEEYASTTVLHPGDALTVDQFGHLVITIKRD